MKSVIKTAGALIALAISASAASAASMPVYGLQAAELEAGIVQVHGLHRSCELGPRGWHRSAPWGRVPCRPVFIQKWRGHHNDHGDRGRGRDDHDGRGRGGSHDGDRGGRGDGGGRGDRRS